MAENDDTSLQLSTQATVSSLATTSPVSVFEGLTPEAQQRVLGSRAPSTIRNYDSAWRAFVAWCSARALSPLPATPETVANYLVDRSKDHAAATITVDRAAIRAGHEFATLVSPTESPKVLLVCRGIRRAIGTNQRGKAALVGEDLAKLIDTLPSTLSGVRDRALLLVGFAGAFRRSELVGLLAEDLAFGRSDAFVSLVMRRSKTDQEGRGLEKAIHAIGGDYCPVGALRAWLDASSVREGAIFRRLTPGGEVSEEPLSDSYVAKLVKRLAERAGLDPSLYAGHSLRAGFVTDAAERGFTIPEIQDQTKHKSVDVLLNYVRRADRTKTNATGRLSLPKKP